MTVSLMKPPRGGFRIETAHFHLDPEADKVALRNFKLLAVE